MATRVFADEEDRLETVRSISEISREELFRFFTLTRQFTPAVLSAVRFAGGTAATELLVAVAMLRELNATGRLKVFEEAPTMFVPTKWRGYRVAADRPGQTHWLLGLFHPRRR